MHWLVLRKVLQTKFSFSIDFKQVYASGMVLVVIYEGFIPYHLMPYALVIAVVVLPVPEL